MPPVRTLLFFVPLVKALRPSTTPAKQLSTASNIKARVASQKAADRKVRTTRASTDGWIVPGFTRNAKGVGCMLTFLCLYYRQTSGFSLRLCL